MEKKSFVLHLDSLSILDKLDEEQSGKLIKAIYAYAKSKETPCDTITNLLFHPFQMQLDRDLNKWTNIRNRNIANGSKGGRPKLDNNPKEPSGLSGNPKEPKKPVSVKGSASASVKGKGKEEKKGFSKPTVDEVIAYANDKKINVAGFFDYYESNGWKVGKNSMKDWQASARGWSSRQQGFNQQQPVNKPRAFGADR